MKPRFSTRSIVAIGLQQIALFAVLGLLVVGWLHIPDANAFEVAMSVVVALLIAGVAGAGESILARRMTRRQVTRRSVLLGAGAVLVAVLLWFAISVGLDHLSANDGLRAGYLNSRFPAAWRNLFSYEHLLVWFGWVWSGLRWIAGGLLAAGAFAYITCDAPLRGFAGILRTRRYWLCLLLVGVAGAGVSGALLGWTPGHSLRAQIVSLAIRLLCAIVLDAVAVALLLQAMASAVLGLQDGGTGEPFSSQPRTADNP